MVTTVTMNIPTTTYSIFEVSPFQTMFKIFNDTCYKGEVT